MHVSDEANTRRTYKHVFVINGVVEVLELIRELLQDEHFNVTTTNFVPRTWDQIEALQPDLLMVDLTVGARDGWELLEKLRYEASTRQIPVIVFSTNPDLLERARQHSDRYGGQRYIAKPFDVDILIAAVHSLIGPVDTVR